MLPIYLCSVATVVVFLRKWWYFRSVRLHQSGWIDELAEMLSAGDRQAAVRHAAGVQHPGGQAATALLQAVDQRPDKARAEGYRVGSLVLQQLESQLGLLAFIAQAAPLLGLLGTVIGMVDLFMGLQQAGDGAVSVGVLSSGIWKALLTTAAGLAVAVPTLAAHTYFASRVDRARLLISDMIQRLLYALPEQPERRP